MNSAQQLHEMTQGRQNGYVYRAAVPASRPLTDYTPRLILYCDGVAVPLEDARNLW
jgi:glycogen phosphorylase